MSGIFILFVIALAYMVIALAPRAPSYRRQRTYREDMLHDKIQAAMNWEPGQASRCECGGWVNSEGEHLKSITLEELMAAHKKPPCNLTANPSPKDTAAHKASRSEE